MYDAWNRLVRVEDGEDTVAEYEYDGRNFRTVKRVYAEGTLDHTRHFYYNHRWQLLEERATTQNPVPSPESLAPASQYVWGERYVDDLICRDRDTDGNGTLDETRYVMQDANWNVAALFDGTGVSERYVYSAYGAPTVLTGAFTSRASSLYAWDHLYTGRQFDPETGLYHYRNRYYAPALGRFLSRDPIGYDAEDLNFYRYVGNRPTMAHDSMGLDITLETGNDSYSPPNNLFHQQVCVDLWFGSSCSEANKWKCCHSGKTCFSFAMTGTQWPQFSRTWLGWNSPVVGAVLQGAIYSRGPVKGAWIGATHITSRDIVNSCVWGVFQAATWGTQIPSVKIVPRRTSTSTCVPLSCLHLFDADCISL